MGVSSIGISAVGISSVVTADMVENVAIIAQNSNILIYGIIPVYTAVFVVWQFLRWFKSTFVK